VIVTDAPASGPLDGETALTVGFAATVPVRVKTCVAAVAYRLLSVRVSEPLTVPEAATGANSIGRLQVALGASVADVEEAVSCGHSPVTPVSRAKFADALGFVPLDGTLKTSGSFP
jgi:hypothetical protein